MNQFLYELLWFFFTYAFAGWVIGTALAAVREKKFVDVGFLYGPLCPAYGLGGVAFALFLTELKDHLFFLFLGGAILSFLMTILTGLILEGIFHRKWWDYSRKRFQFGGYVNLPYSVVWGGLAVLNICVVNPFLRKVFGMIPRAAGEIILIVLLAGYGFAKFNFKGKNSLFLIVLSSTMIPWVATIIPLYILTNSLHLIDTYPGLLIPGMADAFSIFLARNFMSTIPTPLLEAARIDGAGELKVFFRVVIAQVKPLIAVIAIQKMISSWNAFQWPLLVVNSEELRTLPIAMAKLSSLYYDSYNLKMAAATLAIIPVLILYIAFQKYFVEGISLSGIK